MKLELALTGRGRCSDWSARPLENPLFRVLRRQHPWEEVYPAGHAHLEEFTVGHHKQLGMYLMGVYPIGMYLMGMHLKGVAKSVSAPWV